MSANGNVPPNRSISMHPVRINSGVVRVAVGVCGCFAAACEAATKPDVTPARIGLSADAIELAQLDSFRITATALNSSGAAIPAASVSFASSDTRLLSVSAAGVIKSLGPAGAARVEIRSGAAVATVSVSITQVRAKLVVAPATDSLAQLDTLRLQASVVDRIGEPVPSASFTFTSSDTSTARVTPTGLVTSVGFPGTVLITVRSEPFVETVQLRVTQVARTMRVGPARPLMLTNRSLQLDGQAYDLLGWRMPNDRITYRSSDPSVLQVSPTGVLTSLGIPASPQVLLSAGKVTRSITVDIVRPVHPAGLISAFLLATGEPYAIAAMPNEPAAYVVSLRTGVRRLDLSSGVLSQPVVGSEPGRAGAISPDGDELYVLSHETLPTNPSSLDRVVLETPTSVSRIATITLATDIVLSHDGLTAYVASGDGYVRAIELATGRVLASLRLPNAYRLVLHPTQPFLYVTNTGNTITEIHLDGFEVNGHRVFIHPGVQYHGLAFNVDGTRLIAAVFGSNGQSGLDVFDFNSTALLFHVAAPGCGAHAVAVSLDESRAYLTCPSEQKLVIIDLARQRVELTHSAIGPAFGMAWNRYGTALLVATYKGVLFVR
jgi:DNA-binding beta-propeller fold protein YncE